MLTPKKFKIDGPQKAKTSTRKNAMALPLQITPVRDLASWYPTNELKTSAMATGLVACQSDRKALHVSLANPDISIPPTGTTDPPNNSAGSTARMASYETAWHKLFMGHR
jgi:hypothetical protein